MDPDEALAVAFLEKFQTKQYAKLGLPLPQVDSEFDETSIENLGFPTGVDTAAFLDAARFAHSAGSLAPGSRYDAPAMRGYLTEIGREIRDFITPSLNVKQPIFGLSPLLSPNACVIDHKQSGRHIIVFQRGLVPYFMEAIIALVRASPFENGFRDCPLEHLIFSEHWLPIERMNRAVPALLLAVLNGMTGRPAECRAIVQNLYDPECLNYEPSAAQLDLAIKIQDSVSGFVLAHEYGHILAPMGLSIAGAFGKFEGFSEAETEEALRSYAEEAYADRIGTKLALARSASRRAGPECSYLGITLFFELSHLLDRCIALMRDGVIRGVDELDSLTHPPLITRKREAEEEIARMNGDPLDTERGKAISDAFASVIKLFWSTAKPLCEEWHRRNLVSDLLPEYRLRPVAPQPRKA